MSDKGKRGTVGGRGGDRWMFAWKPRGSFILRTPEQCELVSLFLGAAEKFLKSSGASLRVRQVRKQREAKVRDGCVPGEQSGNEL